MNNYGNCFLAVPLPDRFTGPHRALLDTLTGIPGLTVDDPETPHITLFYLGDQPGRSLSAIGGRAATVAAGLRTEVTIGGYGTFPNETRVIYLAVEDNPGLTAANAGLKQELTEFRGEKNRDGYTPHLTVAWSKPDAVDPADLESLEQRLDAVSWSFPVTEIALYGTPPGEPKRTVIERIPCGLPE